MNLNEVLLLLFTNTFQKFIWAVFMLTLIWVTLRSSMNTHQPCSLLGVGGAKQRKEYHTGSARRAVTWEYLVPGRHLLPSIPLTGPVTYRVLQRPLWSVGRRKLAWASFHPHTFDWAEHDFFADYSFIVLNTPTWFWYI